MRSIELIDKAEATGTSLAEWARRLGLSRNALTAARHHGSLSPALAATLAHELGEPVLPYLKAAVLENEKAEPMRRKLTAALGRIA